MKTPTRYWWRIESIPAAGPPTSETVADGPATGTTGDDDVRDWEVVGNTETAATTIAGLTSYDESIKEVIWDIVWSIL